MNIKILFGVFVALIILVVGVLFIFDFSSSTMLVQEDAVDAVIVEYPALDAYRSALNPLSTVEGKQVEDGWNLAFIQRGSGVPGVLNAHCFYVTNDKKVTATGEYIRPGDAYTEEVDYSNCAPINEQSPRNTILPYGDVVLTMGQLAKFENISILPIAIAEDSRCPVDVQCIQAGTVHIEIVSDIGTSTGVVKLGQAFPVQSERVTLTAVAPEKSAKKEITMGDYRLTFNVVQEATPVADTPSIKCYIGGCSSQLCTDNPDVASTCEYIESYACYKTATCEQQTNGQCGWTQTSELTACIENAR